MKRHKKQRDVRSKWFNYVATVVLTIFFVGFLAVSIIVSYQSNRRIYEDVLKTHTVEHIKQLETLFEAYGKHVSFLSTEETVVNLLTPGATEEQKAEFVKELELVLEDSRASLEMFTGVAIQGVDGSLYMNSLEDKLTDERAALLDPTKFLYKDSGYAVTFGKTSEYTGVIVSSKVFGKNQEVIGYIHFFFNTKIYQIANEVHGKGPYLFTSDEWTYLYSKDVFTLEQRTAWLKKEGSLLEMAKENFVAGNNTFSYTNGNGKECFAGIAVSEKYPFGVVVSFELSEMIRSFRPFVIHEIIISGFLLAILILIIYALHKGTEKPVRDMIKQCVRLSKEESDIKIEATSGDRHLRELAGAFNSYSDKIQKIAYEDEFLDIGNRKKCLRDLEALIANPEINRFNVYVIDIVGFGMYNDIFTMEVGNDILRVAKDNLQTLFGEWLYRIDGDVFVGVVFDNEKKQAVVYSILQTIGKKIQIQNLEIELMARIGICEYPTQAKDAKEVLERGQVALHSAKQKKKNFAVYDKGMVKKLRREEEIASLLKRRIKDQELEVWLQPIYYIEDNCFESCEALLRMKDDGGNFISPLEVIEVAEKKGLIDQVTDYVLNKVCQMIHRMRELNTDLKFIRINLSAHQLAQKNYAQVFLDTLARNNVSPDCIGVEVTETLLIQSFETAIITLQTLREHGVRVALDDFGSGYSSINYLCRLPIDTVKLDRELTVQIVESLEQKMFISAIFKLAQIKKMEVLVEGVETEDVVREVIACEADCIQGYYFSKPLPPAEFEQFMIRKKK